MPMHCKDLAKGKLASAFPLGNVSTFNKLIFNPSFISLLKKNLKQGMIERKNVIFAINWEKNIEWKKIQPQNNFTINTKSEKIFQFVSEHFHSPNHT